MAFAATPAALPNTSDCYGPLNPNEPNEEYWQKKADMFQGDLEAAKKALCANCAFFDVRKQTLACIAEGIEAEQVVEEV